MCRNKLHKITHIGFIAVGLLLIQPLASAPFPAPDLSSASVNATSSYDTKNGKFIYSYGVASGIDNKGSIIEIALDIKSIFKLYIPYELEKKVGWIVDKGTLNGFPKWFTGREGLKPGDSISGFMLTSPNPPGLTKMRLKPSRNEFGLYASVDDSDEVAEQMEKFVDSLNVYIYTLGPVGVKPGTPSHWDQFSADLNKSIEIGWITDKALSKTLVDQLNSARNAFNAGDSKLAKTQLKILINKMSGSSKNKRNTEIKDLVYQNARSLLRGITQARF